LYRRKGRDKLKQKHISLQRMHLCLLEQTGNSLSRNLGNQIRKGLIQAEGHNWFVIIAKRLDIPSINATNCMVILISLQIEAEGVMVPQWEGL